MHTSDADPEPEVVEHNIVFVQPQLSRNVELTKIETVSKKKYNVFSLFFY
jgi:hypothetical protein